MASKQLTDLAARVASADSTDAKALHDWIATNGSSLLKMVNEHLATLIPPPASPCPPLPRSPARYQPPRTQPAVQGVPYTLEVRNLSDNKVVAELDVASKEWWSEVRAKLAAVLGVQPERVGLYAKATVTGNAFVGPSPNYPRTEQEHVMLDSPLDQFPFPRMLSGASIYLYGWCTTNPYKYISLRKYISSTQAVVVAAVR